MTRDYLYDILSSLNCSILFSLRISSFSSKVFRWLLLQTERLRDPKVQVEDTVKDVPGAPTKVQGSANKAIPSTTTSIRYAENADIACLEAAIPTTHQICSSPVGLDRLHPAMWWRNSVYRHHQRLGSPAHRAQVRARRQIHTRPRTIPTRISRDMQWQRICVTTRERNQISRQEDKTSSRQLLR